MKKELHGLDENGMLFVYYSATFVDFYQGQGQVLNLLKKRHEVRMPSGWSSSSSSSHTILHLRRGAEKWTFNSACGDNAFNSIYRLHEQPKA